MKKIISVFLALTMLCAIFTVPVAATSSSTIEVTTDDANCGYEYYIPEDQLHVEGWARFENIQGTTILYGVTITNPQRLTITYGYNMQCAVNYDDGTQDFDYYHGSLTLANNDTKKGTGMLFLYYDRTAVSMDAEFHVSSSGYEKWMGYISYTFGINS